MLRTNKNTLTGQYEPGLAIRIRQAQELRPSMAQLPMDQRQEWLDLFLESVQVWVDYAGADWDRWSSVPEFVWRQSAAAADNGAAIQVPDADVVYDGRAYFSPWNVEEGLEPWEVGGYERA